MKEALFQKKNWIKGMLGIVTCAALFCMCGFVSEAATGKVTADTAKIRKEASTDSEVVGSTSGGKTVDIVGAVKDASGTVWYKVPNGNNTYGYIRSDLIETSDSVTVTEAAPAASSENKPADTVPTSIGEMKATITEESIRVRSGASTQHDTVTSLKQGTEITLIGEATDASGNKWYQMTCEKSGRTVTGYVRSDLISIVETTNENPEGENPEGTEGETPEEGAAEEVPVEPIQPAEPEHNDYEVVYNEDQYWLYNNIDSTMMKVEELLNVVNTANQNTEMLQKQIDSNKIIIVILAVIIVILVIGVTLLIFKLRDYYYEDYEEDYDEEDEDEEEEVPVRKRRPVSEEEYQRGERPVRQRPVQGSSQRPVQGSSQRPVQGGGQRPVQGGGQRPAQVGVQRPVQGGAQRPAQGSAPKPAQKPELHAAERKQPEKKPAPRKSQNFLLDDDEFEFEFLNMDDKDL